MAIKEYPKRQSPIIGAIQWTESVGRIEEGSALSVIGRLLHQVKRDETDHMTSKPRRRKRASNGRKEREWMRKVRRWGEVKGTNENEKADGERDGADEHCRKSCFGGNRPLLVEAVGSNFGIMAFLIPTASSSPAQQTSKNQHEAKVREEE
jgi:hypothetical protein